MNGCKKRCRMFVGKDSCGKAVLSVVKLENVAKIGMDLLKVFLMLISQVYWYKIRIWFSVKKKKQTFIALLIRNWESLLFFSPLGNLLGKQSF